MVINNLNHCMQSVSEYLAVHEIVECVQVLSVAFNCTYIYIKIYIVCKWMGYTCIYITYIITHIKSYLRCLNYTVIITLSKNRFSVITLLY